MAGNDDLPKPGTSGENADDLSSLLDSLALEIKGAGSRHTDTLHDMRERLATLSNRATTARPGLPHEHGAAMDRVEAAMTSFAEQLTGAEAQHARPAGPAAESDGALPDTVRAAVRHAIMAAQQDMDDAPPARGPERMNFIAPPPPAAAAAVFGESGEEVLAQPDDRRRSTVAPSAATPVVDPSWLEARFSDIAERVEQSLAANNPHNALLAIGARFDELEQRFDRALDEIASKPGGDPNVLKSVEQQITELVSQLGRAQGQLGRLDEIETRLTDLRQSLSDERMADLIGAHAPTDEKLSAIATAAAERVAATMSRGGPAPQVASEPVSDPRLVELTAMLDAFIGEQRQGDTQTAEALDTMQQAMQHLIDRVEAIEATQISNHEALMRASERAPADPHEAHVFSVRTPEPPLVMMPEASEPPTHLDDSTRIAEPSAHPAGPPSTARRAHADLDDLAANARPVDGDLNREALIAMARRAAEKVSREAKSAPDAAAKRSAPRPGILLAASLAAFLLAGFWLVAGSSLRGLIPSFGMIRGSDADFADDAPSRAFVEKKQGSLSSRRARGDSDGHEPANEGDAAAPERVQLASLSTRAAPDAARTLPVTTTTADLVAALGQGSSVPAAATVPGPSETRDMARSVEMPSAMVGPLSLRSAASKGDPRAQFEVAARFAEGKGVPQDFGQAATWYQRAATQGLPAAQYRLGALYERGLGVTADPNRARVWYLRAAEQGNLRAMHNLAVLSAGRPGASPDYPTAVQWFTEAANRGLADSQYNIGILYESGLGVPANNVEAYKWYSLAARSGDKDAARRRDILRAKLDRANLRNADALVIRWRAKAVDAAANDGRAVGQGWQAVRR